MSFRPNLKNYKDFDLLFEKNELTGDIKARSELASINQSIKNIILTSSGERPFSDFGVGVDFYFFENDDVGAFIGAKSSISRAINFYEPRVTTEYNDIDIQRTKAGAIRINIR
jgi:phage baseplate assembly protein W